MGKESPNKSKLSLGQNQQDSKEPTHSVPNAFRKINEKDLYLKKAQHQFTCTTNTKLLTCLVKQYLQCRFLVTPHGGQCRKPKASAGRETNNSPQRAHCISGSLHQVSLPALSACLCLELLSACL